MNGFHWQRAAFLSILTLWATDCLRGDQLPVEANESACHREKVATYVSAPPLCASEPTFSVVSHRCEGDRCYVVDDDPNGGEAKESSSTVSQPATAEIEAILQSNAAPPMVTSPLVTSPLGRSLGSRIRIPEPLPVAESRSANELIELRAMNSVLATRLEMTQAILELQNHYTSQILSLEREKAKIVAEAAELRVKNAVNEQLTAGLIERTELAAKLTAAHDWISGRTAFEASLPVHVHPSALVANPTYEESIAAIQEDLSNLRRQLPLLKQTPVPFAVSRTVAKEQAYVPLVNKPEATNSRTDSSQSSEEKNSPCREAAAESVGAR